MRRRGDLFTNELLLGVLTLIIVVIALKVEIVQMGQIKHCDGLFNSFIKEHNGTIQNGIGIIQLKGVNITPYYQSFDDVVYSKKTTQNLDWTFFPVLAPKGIYIVPLPTTNEKTVKTQKIPFRYVNLTTIMKIGNQTKVIYYDEHHIFIPIETKGQKFIVVWKMDGCSKIDGIAKTTNGIILKVRR